MGMAGGGMAAGAVLRIAGAITGGIAAEDRRKEFQRMMNELGKPDPTLEEQNWFNDLNKFYPQAEKLSTQAQNDELTQKLALRERAMPGSTRALSDAMNSIAPLLRGELPQSVMDNYVRAGGASTVANGWGGSGFGAMNTGLFGARGALGAISTGIGLLPQLLSSIPHLTAPSAFGLLGQIMTPSQRIGLQMQLRAQQIGMNNTMNELPTALDSWSQHLNESGAMLMGGGAGAPQQQQQPRYQSPDAESQQWTWDEVQPGGTIQPSGGLWGTGE